MLEKTRLAPQLADATYTRVSQPEHFFVLHIWPFGQSHRSIVVRRPRMSQGLKVILQLSVLVGHPNLHSRKFLSIHNGFQFLVFMSTFNDQTEYYRLRRQVGGSVWFSRTLPLNCFRPLKKGSRLV